MILIYGRILKAWELHAKATRGPGVLSFTFLHAHLWKSSPRPGDLSGVATMRVRGSARLTAIVHEYPAPPVEFAADDSVRTLVELFVLAKQQPRILLHLAYSMVTLVRSDYGGFSNAAVKLGIARAVFELVKRMASTRGKGVEARKHESREGNEPLNPEERLWVLERMNNIVLRAGAAVAGVHDHEMITLGTHPPPRS